MTGYRYPPRFWWLCLGAYFFFGSFNMIIPELPGMVERFGETQHKGLIVSLFTLTALVARPFSGRLADSVGRVPVMVVGAACCLLCSLLYPSLAGFTGFVWLRLLHGFSTGFSPTGFSAYVADIIPADRRGEAIGLVTTFGSLGMASSPMFGGWMLDWLSLDAMFITSAVYGLVAMVIFARLPETSAHREPFRARHLLVRFDDLYDPSVWAPCLVMVLTAYSYGAMLTLIPDRSEELGLSNKGSMFMVFALASVAVRIVAGRLSDRFGRIRILMGGVLLLITGMTLASQAQSVASLTVACIAYGMSNGITSPTLFAWATDLCPPERRARAFALLYIALELGIGLGALLSGYLLEDMVRVNSMTFLAGAISGCVALGYLVYRSQFFKKNNPIGDGPRP